ncbi:probable ubiquitin-conjugating enzyme E2 16 isoform X1 [Carica papaya]|uniref:probable ubiquitin-conjugating enzyme E2 16 isoform X1 n=1 Tax=Carica papaya TaxID=3649 RepID=UPI000B8CBCFA|nr:probable ubiquitin-conjugating enzyme E2 16 isoform X1 [Carica papaya]
MTSSSAAARKTLSKIACNRLQKELVEWQVNPPAGFKHKVTDNLQRWVIEVNGAPGTLYANETYQLQVDFPEHYPMEAPQVIFLHPAPLHPHIYSNGHICLGKSHVIFRPVYLSLFEDCYHNPVFWNFATRYLIIMFLCHGIISLSY